MKSSISEAKHVEVPGRLYTDSTQFSTATHAFSWHHFSFAASFTYWLLAALLIERGHSFVV